jgi:toxin ParE1/3/4
MKVRYSDRAKADLRTLINHISNHNPSAARKLNRAIREAVASLRHDPRRAQRATVTSAGEMRRLIVRPYLIFYEIEGRSVAVLRILHGARDIPTALNESAEDLPDET